MKFKKIPAPQGSVPRTCSGASWSRNQAFVYSDKLELEYLVVCSNVSNDLIERPILKAEGHRYFCFERKLKATRRHKCIGAFDVLTLLYACVAEQLPRSQEVTLRRIPNQQLSSAVQRET